MSVVPYFKVNKHDVNLIQRRLSVKNSTQVQEEYCSSSTVYLRYLVHLVENMTGFLTQIKHGIH